jgi:exodeoxyribonuclease V alpha subunit
LESSVLQKIEELNKRTPPSFDRSRFLSFLKWGKLQEDQIEAIEKAYSHSFSLFTGGPGTGKTYTAGSFIRALALAKEGPLKVAVAAPTGKAAAHLESAIHEQGEIPKNLLLEATTLHRLLRIAPRRERFGTVGSIDADLVVVDEASMLDISLLLHLLSSIAPQTRLLLLGDPDQLPPVESGSLFSELSELMGTRLQHSHRMGQGNLLGFAKAINQGNSSSVYEYLSGNEDILWIEKSFSLQDRDKLVEWLMEQLPSPLSDDEPNPQNCMEIQGKFRILSGLRQGPLGIDELNRLIYNRYLSSFRNWIAIPILIIKNDLRQNLYNGTAGVLIRKCGQRGGVGYFLDGEGVKMIPEEALPPYELGFCLSVHKSQGSEFDEVLALFLTGSERFGREALYTAVTRAKRRVFLCANRETIEKTLASCSRRISGLKARIDIIQKA